MRVLFVAPYVPSRVRVRPYELIRALARLGHRVHLVMVRPPEDGWAPAAPLRDVCEQVDVFDLSRGRTLLNAARALAGSGPLQGAYARHPAASNRLGHLVASGGHDVLHVEHLRGVPLVAGLSGIPIVFDAVDSIAHLFGQTVRHAARWQQRLTARLDLRRTERFEARAPFLFERMLVTSPVDRDAFVVRAGPGSGARIDVLPNGVDWEYFAPGSAVREPATIIFTGKMSYHANEAAAMHLARRVMPGVWAARRDARLVIAGKDPSAALQALAADPRIEVTGYVDDLRPLFARAAVAVSPLLYGAGIQNKILEAMASGVPVVTSPQACASLTATPGLDLLVGATPDETARQVLRVFEEPGLAGLLGAAGLSYVKRCHDWTEVGRRLVAVYDRARSDYARVPLERASR
jgi:glycosyltransferase involved in cell wall biosynthesis